MEDNMKVFRAIQGFYARTHFRKVS